MTFKGSSGDKLKVDVELNPAEHRKGKRVLIVEDMTEMRSILRSLMMGLGYVRIDVESSGSAAIKSLLGKHYDIIISDYNLGGKINGQHILETARKKNPSSNTSIFIMVTADVAYSNVASVVEYMPDSYLVKPFTTQSFQRRFERIEKQKMAFHRIEKYRITQDFVQMGMQAKVLAKQQPHLAMQCQKTLCESLIARKKYEEAKSHYERIISEKKKIAWAHYGVSLCEIALGNVSAAKTYLEETIQQFRHFFSAYDLLSEVQQKLGDNKAAQKTMLTLCNESPYSVERAEKLGRISCELEDWKNAELAYYRVLRLTADTKLETITHYYNYLQAATNLMKDGDESSRLSESFRRSLSRLRIIGKDDPIVSSNSYRVEVQQYLNKGNTALAVKTWEKWNKKIKEGRASAISDAQRATIVKKLGMQATAAA